MIVHLDKEQTRLERRRLLADNSDIVFVLFHDILKELHKDGKTQLSAVEAFLSARELAKTLVAMNEPMEGLEDEIDDLEDEADGENDAMIMSMVACAIIKAYAKAHAVDKAHAVSGYDEVVMAIWCGGTIIRSLCRCSRVLHARRRSALQRTSAMICWLMSWNVPQTRAMRR